MFFLVKSIRICQNFSAKSLYSLYCIWLNHRPWYKWYVFFLVFQGYHLAKYPQTLMHIFWNMGQPSNFLLKVLRQLRVRKIQFCTISPETVLDAVARVRAFILSNPDVLNDTSKPITGGGWDHTVWPSTSWPTSVR